MSINFNLTAPLILAIGLGILSGIILAVLGLFVKKKPATEEQKDDALIRRAVVLCSGISNISPGESEYQGYASCKSAKLFFGGPKNCKYGCIGQGDCAKACPQKAIEICNGLAMIDRDKCNGCGICKDACPQKLIKLLPKSQITVAACNSKDTDQERFEVCSASCINCGACKKICHFDAISLKNGIARIDPNKCVNCGECIRVCPRKCIQTLYNDKK